MTKRNSDKDGWIRCKKPKMARGIFIETDDLKKATTPIFIPEWITNESSVLDHVLDEGDNQVHYPVSGVSGVTQKSLEDCKSLFTMSKELMVNGTVKWKYYSGNKKMTAVLHQIYRWRTRLGYLISTAGFFGWKLIQDLADTVMSYRVENSYAADIQYHLFSNGTDEYKNDALLNFFVQKLSYTRIHLEMLSTWITSAVLNGWIYKCIKKNEVETVNRNMLYLTKNFNFKLMFWKFRVPSSRYPMSLSSLFGGVTTAMEFQHRCNFVTIVCGQTSLFKKRISFYGSYYVFKFIWQISDELFETILQNIRDYSIGFDIISETMHESYRQYFNQLFTSVRTIDFFPPSAVIERWVALLNVLGAPENTLTKIMTYFPHHCKHCSETFTF